MLEQALKDRGDYTDFGNDSSDYAFDGECDDPRFVGKGVHDENLDEDMRADATDCRWVVYQGQARLRSIGSSTTVGDDSVSRTPMSNIDFGYDLGEYTEDDECDDARFMGEDEGIVDEGAFEDQTDCEFLYMVGRIDYIPDLIRQRGISIDFGRDDHEDNFDAECDDPRFTGSGVYSSADSSGIRNDATDCMRMALDGKASLK